MPDMRPMTARDWRVAVFAFVAACAAVATFGLAEHAVDRRLHPTCAVRLASDRSWTPVNFNDGLPPAGCRVRVTQIQEAQK